MEQNAPGTTNPLVEVGDGLGEGSRVVGWLVGVGAAAGAMVDGPLSVIVGAGVTPGGRLGGTNEANVVGGLDKVGPATALEPELDDGVESAWSSA